MTTSSDQGSRYACVLTAADAPACTQIALVTITDPGGDRARGCPEHAMRALEGITGAAVDWADTKGLNEFYVKALEITEEIATRPSLQAARNDPEAEL